MNAEANNPRTATITADPALPKITISREFDATPAQVYRAHVDPELFARWAGPDHLSTTIDHWDARRGGSYGYANHEDGKEIASFFGSFHEVRENERIVQTWTWEGMPDAVSLDAMTFTELPGGRCLMSSVSIVESMEAQAAMLASGMEVGVDEGYVKLDAILAAES